MDKLEGAMLEVHKPESVQQYRIFGYPFDVYSIGYRTTMVAMQFDVPFKLWGQGFAYNGYPGDWLVIDPLCVMSDAEFQVTYPGARKVGVTSRIYPSFQDVSVIGMSSQIYHSSIYQLENRY